ncbi:hypothetical protein DIPPA_31518 [Diplonema papillatum]|nr:hypothetical protein DIPPA_31518 [Diplonema papillatum]
MAPSILCLSLPRTGTLSMAEALAELGYKSYHSVKYVDDKRHWDLVHSLGKKRFEGKHVSPPLHRDHIAVLSTGNRVPR